MRKFARPRRSGDGRAIAELLGKECQKWNHRPRMSTRLTNVEFKDQASNGCFRRRLGDPFARRASARAPTAVFADAAFQNQLCTARFEATFTGDGVQTNNDFDKRE